MAEAKPPVRRRRGSQRRREIAGLLFVLPAMALVTVFFLIPLAMTVWMSFHDWPLMGTPEWIGLENYTKLWGDRRFWNAMEFTARYSIVATIAIFGVAFPLALFVERPGRMAGIYRTAFFLPVVVGFGSASLLWAWFMNVDSGLFSPAAQLLGITEKPVNLMASTGTVFWSIMVLVVWKTAGFTMILLMTGLQSVPHDILEAAHIDGANRVQRFWKIKLPLMKRTLALALILSVAGSMLAFDQFYIISNGGPRNSTLTAVYWIFSQSFVSFKLGYGAALSMVLLAILVAISLVQLWLLRTREEAR
ncbi:MAG: sugar ABC transporter permease [Candidatus Saccharibacteria bacterium]|nr:sugar ABC transporter permease [Pseudorhodobacter sp.]